MKRNVRDKTYSAYYKHGENWVGPFGRFSSPDGKVASATVSDLKKTTKKQVKVFEVQRADVV